jgi:hypothetical protein
MGNFVKIGTRFINLNHVRDFEIKPDGTVVLTFAQTSGASEVFRKPEELAVWKSLAPAKSGLSELARLKEKSQGGFSLH